MIGACKPGVYAGAYDITVLFGPISFELVPAANQPSPGTCQEFCPDLVLSSEGGQFQGATLGFVGNAKLKGGLDCRTGEFRAEMVDGRYGFSLDPNGDPDPLLGGVLTGVFTGMFNSSGQIVGKIMCQAEGQIIEGTFDVTLAP